MTLHAGITLTAVLGSLLLLALTRTAAYLVLVGAAVLLLVTGVLPASGALAGLASPAVTTVAALFVVSGALTETGALALPEPRAIG